jgi:CDP-6-deoxy-D-xylo-4-hexulose-3-dehydrase
MTQYRLAEATIDRSDREALIAWLQTDPWLTQGPLVAEFERRWAEWVGARHATFVNSGSSANLLMYYALLVSGRLRNRKVIVPAVSWATTVAPAIQLGFEPIMCEADKATFGLDPTHLEQLLRVHDPAVVMLVHVLGVPGDLASIAELRQRYDFALLEDACAATGSRYDGRRVGSFGALSSFSFYYGHHLSTIEGGMVCTDDEALHDVLVELRSHGWAKDLAPDKEEAAARRYGVIDFNRTFTFYTPGFNVRSTDLNAHLGLSQLAKADAVVERRIANHRLYQQRFREAEGFVVQRNERATIASISFAALAASETHRTAIGRALGAAGIETRPLGGGNMSRQPYWADRYPTTPLPMADRIHTTSFQLPNHAQLDEASVHHICDTVLAVSR